MEQLELLKHTDKINELLARYGVKFGIYKNNEFKEQLFPFDSIPRIIEHEEFHHLEQGLKQRKVRPYDTATLNYNWQVWETQAFSLYTSTTSRIDQNSAG